MQKRPGLSLTSNSEDHPIVFAPANHRRLHNRRFNSRVVDWPDDAKKGGPRPGRVRSSVCFTAECVQMRRCSEECCPKTGKSIRSDLVAVSDYVITHTSCCQAQLPFAAHLSSLVRLSRFDAKRQGRMPTIEKGSYNLPIGTCRPPTTVIHILCITSTHIHGNIHVRNAIQTLSNK
jgi:hypothetical protein